MTGYKKPPKNGQFTKNDARINRNGQPKKFAILCEIFEKQAYTNTDNSNLYVSINDIPVSHHLWGYNVLLRLYKDHCPAWVLYPNENGM